MYIYREKDHAEPSFYFDDFISPLRSEELVVRERRSGRRQVQRIHKKNTNVFKDWKPDCARTLDLCLESD